jgi:hypothetical protein
MVEERPAPGGDGWGYRDPPEATIVKPIRKSCLASSLAALLAFSPASPAVGDGLSVVWLKPEEIKLGANPDRSRSMDVATFAGDMAGPGLYAVRVQPHGHPDDHAVVVRSGTPRIGFGEPAGTPHFARVRGADTIVRTSGIGPADTVDPGTGVSGR